jgi:16S rRNA (cytosine967-C5)-methyltransferase
MVSAPRQIAARLLRAADDPGDFLENRLEYDRGFQALRPDDRRLAQELVFGVTRWRAALDALIARKGAPGKAQHPTVAVLLRLGLYQIFWLDRIPEFAAVNETVELARELGFESRSGFINAVLRAYVRERPETRAELDRLRLTDPATGWSHPAWLIERWRNALGDEDLRRLLSWNNTPPRNFARVNTLRLDYQALLDQWHSEEVDYEFCRHDWTGENLVFQIRSHPPLDQLPSFQQGGFYVQDPSTLLAVRELDPQPGEWVLDWCAAPGGKATFCAQLMGNRGRIVAHDTSPERMGLLRENCTRLGVTCLEAVPASFTPRHSSFDRILVDAPCSNTGVLRRRIELRWRIQPEEITRLAVEQLAILHEVSPALKSGGTLVYSTCSLEAEENHDVVARFVGEETDFELVRELQLHPVTAEVDGAYVAVLRRK